MRHSNKLLFLTFLFFTSGYCQNLITNPDFDTGILGWTDYGNASTTTSWNGQDGALSNGSLEISDTINNGGVVRAYWETAIPVVSGEKYYAQVMSKVIGSSEAQAGYLWIDWLDENQNYVGHYSTLNLWGVFDSWEPILGVLTVPDGMKYARFHVGLATNDTGSPNPSTVLFDDIVFIEDLIFSNSFEEIVAP